MKNSTAFQAPSVDVRTTPLQNGSCRHSFQSNRTRLGVNGLNLAAARRSFNTLPSRCYNGNLSISCAGNWTKNQKGTGRSSSKDKLQESLWDRNPASRVSRDSGSEQLRNLECLKKEATWASTNGGIGHENTHRTGQDWTSGVLDQGTQKTGHSWTTHVSDDAETMQDWNVPTDVTVNGVYEAGEQKEDREDRMNVMARTLSVTVDPESYRFTPIHKHPYSGEFLSEVMNRSMILDIPLEVLPCLGENSCFQNLTLFKRKYLGT